MRIPIFGIAALVLASAATNHSAAGCVFGGSVAAAATTEAPLTLPQPVTVGPLALEAKPASGERSVLVIVQLQNVTVGAQTLTAPFPTYTFSVTVGTTSAWGSLTALFMPPGQLSTVTASVTVEVQGQAKQPFVGLVQTFQVSSTKDSTTDKN